MRTVGIIAEYDPFHKGHAWHMKTARRSAGADYVVVAMSPDFLQRGTPALIDKWVRARMALEAGADLVLELPVRSAVGSAEYFARGGVHLLESLGCVDALSFGCESADRLNLLERAAHFFSQEEPEEYRQMLKKNLRSGISYPKARASAFAAACHGADDGASGACTGTAAAQGGASGTGIDPDTVMDVLSRPNNILAIEYMKAIRRLGSNMKPVPVKRLGDYHDRTDLAQEASCKEPPKDGSYASASAIRAALLSHDMLLPSAWNDQLPETSRTLFQSEIRSGRYVLESDLDVLMHRELIEKQDVLQEYIDVDEDLAGRIRRCLRHYTGFAQFAGLVQSRQYTLSRIRRSLLHVLLGIRKDTRPLSCARVLGFRTQAQPLLHQIRAHGTVSLSTSVPFSEIPEEDIRAAHLWEMLVTNRTRQPLRHERQRQVIRICS